MQFSRFTVAYPKVEKDENVLYNVLTGRYIGLNDQSFEVAERIKSGLEPVNEEESSLCNALEEQGFLVQDRSVDDQRLREHLEKAAVGMPGTMYVTLMPTLACNLACNYCFQKEFPSYNRMRPEIEKASIEFILQKVDAAATPKLIVHYFGGEPLTRKDLVLRSAEIFHSAMRARGGSFAWEITTNGINLDRAFIDAMNHFGEGNVKITLDGDQETHDNARVYRNGKGTFEIIFKNIVEIVDHVKLRIGGNFLPEHEESYIKLIQRLDDTGILKKLDSIRFKPIHPTAATKKSSCMNCTSTSKPEHEVMARLDRELHNKMGPNNTNHTFSVLRNGPCELHWNNQYIIDPNGLLYKCPAVAGKPEVAIGSVTVGVKRGAPLLELRPWQQCGDCSYLPVCVGGCLGGKYLETGRRDEVNCKKELYEISCRESVIRDYLEELGSASWDNKETMSNFNDMIDEKPTNKEGVL